MQWTLPYMYAELLFNSVMTAVCGVSGPSGYGNMHPHSEGQLPAGQAQSMFMNMNVSLPLALQCLLSTIL